MECMGDLTKDKRIRLDNHEFIDHIFGTSAFTYKCFRNLLIQDLKNVNDNSDDHHGEKALSDECTSFPIFS